LKLKSLLGALIKVSILFFLKRETLINYRSHIFLPSKSCFFYEEIQTIVVSLPNEFKVMMTDVWIIRFQY